MSPPIQPANTVTRADLRLPISVWAVSSPFLGVYAIVQDLSVPIILQPQSFGLLSACSVAQCMYYGKGRGKNVCIAFVLVFAVIMAGFEVGMVYAIRVSLSYGWLVHKNRALIMYYGNLQAGMDNGVDWPVTLFGSISAALLAGALIPQYLEIYRLKEVKGKLGPSYSSCACSCSASPHS